MALRNKVFRIPKESFTYPYFTLNVTNSGEDWNASATTTSGVTIQSIKWYVDGSLVGSASSVTIDSSYNGSLLLVDAVDNRGLKMHYTGTISYVIDSYNYNGCSGVIVDYPQMQGDGDTVEVSLTTGYNPSVVMPAVEAFYCDSGESLSSGFIRSQVVLPTYSQGNVVALMQHFTNPSIDSSDILENQFTSTPWPSDYVSILHVITNGAYSIHYAFHALSGEVSTLEILTQPAVAGDIVSCLFNISNGSIQINRNGSLIGNFDYLGAITNTSWRASVTAHVESNTFWDTLGPLYVNFDTP